MSINVGDRVKVANGDSTSRPAPDSTVQFGVIPQDAEGTVVSGPTTDQSGQTQGLYYQVDWDAPALADGWMVEGSLAEVVPPPTTGSIAGVVRDAAGAGIVATITAGAVSVTSASDGTYSIPDLAPGTYSLTASQAGFVSQTASVSVTAGATSTQDFTLQVAPGSISGVVKDEAGAAIAGATVTVPGGVSVQTATDGTYSVSNLPPASYTLTVSKTGFESLDQTTVVGAGQGAVLNFTLRAVPVTGSLHGIVRDPSGVGIPGADVTIIGGPAIPVPAVTAVDGSYVFDGLVPGSYSVEANKVNWIMQTRSIAVLAGQLTTLDFTLQPIPAPGTGGLTPTERTSLQNVIWAAVGGKAGDAGSLSEGLSAQVDLILRTQTNATTRNAIEQVIRLVARAQKELGAAVADLVGATTTPTGQPRSFYVDRAKNQIAFTKNTTIPSIRAAADAAIAVGAVGSGTATMQRFKDIALNGATAKLNLFNASLAYADPFPPGRSPGGGRRITIIGPHGDYIKAQTWMAVTAMMWMDRMYTAALDGYGADNEPLLPAYENTYQRFKFIDLIMRKQFLTVGTYAGLTFNGYSSDAFFRTLRIVENLTHGGGGPVTVENDCSPDFCHGASYDFNNMQLWTIHPTEVALWPTRPVYMAKCLEVIRTMTEVWQAFDTGGVWYSLTFPECEVTGGCGGE